MRTRNALLTIGLIVIFAFGYAVFNMAKTATGKVTSKQSDLEMILETK